jgi:hypothetical protein
MVGVQQLPVVEKQPNTGNIEIEEQLELFADLLVELILKNEE